MNSKNRLITDITPANSGANSTPVAKATVTPRPRLSSAQISDLRRTRQTETPKTHAVKPVEPVHKVLPATKKRDPKHLTIAEHLQELRGRLLWSAVALMIGGVLGYVYNDQIIAWLVKPLNQQLYYTSPAGGFDFLIKVCVFFGFLLAIPVLVYQLIRFLSPAVPANISYKTGKILVISVILALAGVSFAYYVSLPAALHFLSNFSTGSVTSLISANEYFNFVMIYMVCFAVLFQMPLVIAFVNKVTPLSPKVLMQKQRVVILASFIIAALVTPTPDPLNQTLMALPIIALYQSSIGVVWQSNRRTQKRRSYSANQFTVATA